MPQKTWSAKRERQYEHIKESAKEQGASTKRESATIEPRASVQIRAGGCDALRVGSWTETPSDIVAFTA